VKVQVVAKSELQGVLEAVKEIQTDQRRKLEKVMQYIGIKTIAYLRELINETRPPIRKGEPARRARQGHWADNTGNLARAYSWDVAVHSDGVTLTLMNNMEYAAALDAKEGFFVLRGVTDKGGPVERMLRDAVKAIAPDWEITNERWEANLE
jgi:hypothetical protein